MVYLSGFAEDFFKACAYSRPLGQGPHSLQCIRFVSMNQACSALTSDGHLATFILAPETCRSSAQHGVVHGSQGSAAGSESIALWTSDAMARALSQACSRSPRTVPRRSGIASS